MISLLLQDLKDSFLVWVVFVMEVAMDSVMHLSEALKRLELGICFSKPSSVAIVTSGKRNLARLSHVLCEKRTAVVQVSNSR